MSRYNKLQRTLWVVQFPSLPAYKTGIDQLTMEAPYVARLTHIQRGNEIIIIFDIHHNGILNQTLAEFKRSGSDIVYESNDHRYLIKTLRKEQYQNCGIASIVLQNMPLFWK